MGVRAMYKKEDYEEFYDKTAKNVRSRVPYLYGKDILSRYWDMREKDIVQRLINVQVGSMHANSSYSILSSKYCFY